MKAEELNSGQKFRPVKTLDTAVALGYLKDIPDILAAEVKAETKYLDGINCMLCGSKEVQRIPLVINGKPVFGEYLPKNIIRCLECRGEFEPYTKVIVK